MNYIDTNIFILAQTEASARTLLTQLASGTLEGATSCLTWDEIVWTLKKHLPRTTVIQTSKQFLHFPHLVFLELNSDILEIAHDLIERHTIHPRDALHAATALHNGIRTIVSNDTDFDRIKELHRLPLKRQ